MIRHRPKSKNLTSTTNLETANSQTKFYTSVPQFCTDSNKNSKWTYYGKVLEAIRYEIDDRFSNDRYFTEYTHIYLTNIISLHLQPQNQRDIRGLFLVKINKTEPASSKGRCFVNNKWQKKFGLNGLFLNDSSKLNNIHVCLLSLIFPPQANFL